MKPDWPTCRNLSSRQPVSRQPGLSYKHSKNFIRTQGISRASRIKQASWANRAGSLHINRPLTLCSHYARYLCSGKKTKPGIGLLFTLKNCDFGAISGKEPSCALPISKGSLAYKNYSRAIRWTKVEKENDERGACVKMINGVARNQKCKCGWENIKRVG